jgi:hypothetical protein
LVELLGRIEAGTDVAPRDLKNVLTKAEFDEYQVRWQEQKNLRDDAKNKPSVVVEYEARLKKALFAQAKVEAHARSSRAKGPNVALREAVSRAQSKAESEFERLLEFLEEQHDIDPSICIWFDRPLVFGWEGELGPDPDAVPRVVTSFSQQRRGDRRLVGEQRKREMKQQALQSALDTLDAELAMARRVAEQIAAEDAKARAAETQRRRALFSRK